MNRQRRIFTATLALISLIGEISNFSPAAAASHYPLWVCAGRYGGWGWSRPAGLFGNLTLDSLASALANPCMDMSIGIPPTVTSPFIMLIPILIAS